MGGGRSRRTPIYHAIDRASLRRYDRAICVSDDLLNQCLDARIPIDRCAEISNAIDLSAYTDLPDRESAERDRDVSDRPVIGAIGRLSHEKAFDVLINAVDQLIDTGLEATLLIAGDGPERETLQQQIDSLGRSNHIQLLGHIADPRELFAALDAFAISSRSEGLPNVLLESLACGVPVVSTTVGGIPRVVLDENDALLVEPDDVNSLTLALARVLSNPSLAQQLGERGRETARSRYSFSTRMRKIAAIYDELLGITPSQPRFTTDCDQRPPTVIVPETTEIHQPEMVGDLPTFEPNPESESSLGTAIAVLEMPRTTVAGSTTTPNIHVELTGASTAWTPYLCEKAHTGFYQRAEWQSILHTGLQQSPVRLQALAGDQLVGVLPLAFVESRLFGRFLVSLPYLNSVGVVAETQEAATALVDRAIELADRLDVRYLELRHETLIEHSLLTEAVTDKVHMRLTLPETTDELWSSFKSKLRSQIRKPLKNEALTVRWGGCELLDEFYSVFTQNMRDLGTPPFNRKLFASILNEFSGDAEFCCIRLDDEPVASGLLVHGPDVTEVPSASSLRRFNSTSANMLLYWHLLSRSVERGQSVFDFGRSSNDSGTFKFKAQWGAEPSPAVWQHYVRQGEASDMRPNSGKYDLMIRTWQKLPVWVTKVIGPSIVRGIP